MPVIHMRGAHYSEIAKIRRRLLLRLDALGARRARGRHLHPVGARIVESATAPASEVVMLLPIHIAAGGLAIVLGAVALSVKKGGNIHRRSGLLFVYAMLVMGVSASILSLLKGRDNGNVVAGVLTAYFVGTAFTTVRPASSWTLRINAVALTVAVGLAVGCAGWRSEVDEYARRRSGGVPFRTAGVMSLIVGAVLVMAAAGDVRIMRFGMARGGPRLSRHLWRMCFALFIAAGSFFSVRERVATNPSGAVHDRADARAADRAVVWRDVLLAMEGPRPPYVASARPTRFRRGRTSRELTSRIP